MFIHVCAIHCVGQGLGEDVPRHLRVEGAVKHRHMTQREANHIINGFWHHRLMSALDSEQAVSHKETLRLARN